jgi:hypothetical protein
MGKISWLWVEKGATASISHTSCDDCDPELLLLLLFTTQGKERGKGRESGLGTEGLGNRNGGDGWDETGLEPPPCRPTVLLTRPVEEKRKFGAGRQGREGERGIGTIFLFPCVLVLGVFFLVYMIIFLFEDPLEWTLFGEKLGRSIHVLALCHSGSKLSFLLRCIWS